MRKSFLIIIAFFVTSLLGKAQQVISGGAGNNSTTGGSVSFTVGQTTYTTMAGNNGTAYQGIQLPYEIMVVTTQENVYKLDAAISFSPNPVSDLLRIKISGFDNMGSYHYLLFSSNGQQIKTEQITDVEYSVDFSHVPNGVYQLKVWYSNNSHTLVKSKTFKIIKN